MPDVRIVTDSATLFLNKRAVKDHRITVVPAYVQLGEKTFRYGVDIGHDEFMYRMHHDPVPVKLLPPTPDDFLNAYTQLNFETKHIISIHAASSLSAASKNAEIARKQILGRTEIGVIDSQSLSIGVGMLVERAAMLAYVDASFEDIVRDLRKAINRLYAVFYVNSMETICRNGYMGEAQAILGSMLGIKPFITIENGEIILIEKVQTTHQATDKLAEYVGEFLDVEQVAILTYADELITPVRLLQDRLALELSRLDVPTHQYGPMLATILGLDAIGLVILEGSSALDDFED